MTDENLFIIGAFATKGGNKGLDFLKGNFKISVPKKAPASPASPTVSAPASAPAGQPAAPAPSGNAKTYRVSVSGQSFDLLVERL